jgi:hypothetical protein
MRISSVGAGLVASVVSLLACGGGAPPAAAPPGATSDAGAETFAEVNPADLAELDAGAAPAPSGPVASSSSGGPSSPPAAAPSTPEDPCTAVGADFERRARPKMKDCYAEAKKKEPNLQGTVKIKVDIDIRGKIKATKVIDKTLPEPVAQCMLKAVKATPLPDALKCAGLSLTIPMTFPTPR